MYLSATLWHSKSLTQLKRDFVGQMKTSQVISWKIVGEMIGWLGSSVDKVFVRFAIGTDAESRSSRIFIPHDAQQRCKESCKTSWNFIATLISWTLLSVFLELLALLFFKIDFFSWHISKTIRNDESFRVIDHSFISQQQKF